MTTQLTKYTDRIKHADLLIRHRATGTPKQFAGKLSISESHLYNLLEELRLLGMPLKYSKEQQTYYYTELLQLKVDISVTPLNDSEISSIDGGRNINTPCRTVGKFCYFNQHYHQSI
jgi:hypothetical protein